ncbi:hypothetical protein T03_5916, partial [Trichinella britovi]
LMNMISFCAVIMEFKELVDRRDIMCCLMKATWMR